MQGIWVVKWEDAGYLGCREEMETVLLKLMGPGKVPLNSWCPYRVMYVPSRPLSNLVLSVQCTPRPILTDMSFLSALNSFS